VTSTDLIEPLADAHRLSTDGSRSPCVVVLEPHETTAQLIAASLAHAGFRCVIVRRGEDALASVAHWRPELIVCDVRLPGLRAQRLFDELDARVSDPRPRRIVLSALPESLRAEVLRMGADEFLPKPFDPQELLELCTAILGSEDRLEETA
jgi:two-component system response regulator AdeR